MTELRIALPATEQSAIRDMLYAISERLASLQPEAQRHGFLGGEHGYGQEYENDTFSMFPFYWGDCDCGQEEKRDAAEAEWERQNHSHTGGCTAKWQSSLNCTCGLREEWLAYITPYFHLPTCSLERPNFVYKPTGWKLQWYKYIGRDMEYEAVSPEEVARMLAACLSSLPQN